jgi:oxidoreductase
LIVGATGAVGKHVLRELLVNPEFTRVAEYGRRVTPPSDLAPQNPPGKLEQKTVDFEKIGEDKALKEGKFDVVLIT